MFCIEVEKWNLIFLLLIIYLIRWYCVAILKRIIQKLWKWNKIFEGFFDISTKINSLSGLTLIQLYIVLSYKNFASFTFLTSLKFFSTEVWFHLQIKPHYPTKWLRIS